MYATFCTYNNTAVRSRTYLVSSLQRYIGTLILAGTWYGVALHLRPYRPKFLVPEYIIPEGTSITVFAKFRSWFGLAYFCSPDLKKRTNFPKSGLKIGSYGPYLDKFFGLGLL